MSCADYKICNKCYKTCGEHSHPVKTLGKMHISTYYLFIFGIDIYLYNVFLNYVLINHFRLIVTFTLAVKEFVSSKLRKEQSENFGKLDLVNLCWCLTKFGFILFYFYICDRTYLFEKIEK